MTAHRLTQPISTKATAKRRLTKDELGRLGEQQAVDYLAGRGYLILDRNWRSRIGEIDIVARDGDVLVFVEVKTRSTDRFGLPVEAVGPVKLARVRTLAGEWMHEHQGSWARVRIDVVSVLGIGAQALIDHRIAVG